MVAVPDILITLSAAPVLAWIRRDWCREIDMPRGMSFSAARRDRPAADPVAAAGTAGSTAAAAARTAARRTAAARARTAAVAAHTAAARTGGAATGTRADTPGFPCAAGKRRRSGRSARRPRRARG